MDAEKPRDSAATLSAAFVSLPVCATTPNLIGPMVRPRTRRVGIRVVNARLVFRYGFELVADAVARLDEGVPGRAAVDLLAQPAHEDVDRPVAMRLAAAPELLQQLVPRRDAAAVEGELVQEPELGRRQLRALAVDVRLHLARVDAELLDLDRLAARRLLAPDAPACGGADACDELLHRERLHEVVVGADLERVDPVVLGAAGRDDDDRGADSLGANRLDHLPAVEAGQHQVEHAGVRLLVAEPRQALVAVADPDGVEAGGAQVTGDSLGDHLVVLDDQDLGHAVIIESGQSPTGRRRVNGW